MKLKLCPKCKQLPTTKIEKLLIGYECMIHCNTLGCKLFWPIVTRGLRKNETVARAGEMWNEAVDGY